MSFANPTVAPFLMSTKLHHLSSFHDGERPATFGPVSISSGESLSAVLISEFGEMLAPISLEELDDLRRNYAGLIIQLDRLRGNLVTADLRHSEQEGAESIKEILGHMIDTDRDIWWPRIERILHEDTPQFQDVDHLNLLERHRWQTLPLDDILAQLMRVRWSYAIELNGLSADVFLRTGIHPSLGELSILKIVQLLVAHDSHYLRKIRAKLDVEEA